MKRRTFLKTTIAALALTFSSVTVGVRTSISSVYSKMSPRPAGLKGLSIPKWNRVTDDVDTAEFFARWQEYELIEDVV